jgi:CheY-like chemotaxis protein
MVMKNVKTDKKTVLVVDDEDHVRSLLKRILSNGYTIIEATNGQQALNSIHNQRPDIILMDIMMPKMNGDVACHIIKNDPLTSDIPVIMLTALDYELNKKLSLDVMGADDYITKPFDPQTLMAAINKLLDNK